MKIKLIGMVLALTLAVTSVNPAVVNAKATQSEMTSAKEVKIGEAYSHVWEDFGNAWCKFTVPQRGIISFNVTKPYHQSMGYLDMHMYLYDANGVGIAYIAGTDSASKSTRSWGLNPGTYYFRFEPSYGWVGGQTTDYSITFTANNNCEIESNRSRGTATPLQVGVAMTGFMGGYQSDSDKSAMDFEEDFYRVSLVKGRVYRLSFNQNCGIVKIYGKNTKDKELTPSNKASNFCLAPGDTFVAPYSGNYYVHIHNFGDNEQRQYKLLMSDLSSKKPAIKSLKAGKKSLTVKWGKVSCSGYQVQYSTNKNFKKAKTVTVAGNKTSVTVKKLSSKKKYYVRIRTYRNAINKTKGYSAWSNAKTVKVK